MGKRNREESDDEILQILSDVQKRLGKRRRKPTSRKRRRMRVISSEDETDDSTNAYDTTTPTSNNAAIPANSFEPSTTSTNAMIAETCIPVNQTEQHEVELDDEIIQLLGDAPRPETQLGPNVHKNIASRWQEILTNGLTKETKEKILKEHLIPANCESLTPPLLNAEVKAAMPESLIKRDTFLAEKQRQIGIVLAALAKATDMLIKKDDQSKILKAVSDAGRVLCDVHCNETKSRKSFIISATNANIKEALLGTKTNKYLFGDNVSDTVKSAKNIQRSGEDLKQSQRNTNPKFNKTNFYKNKPLNTRAPQRKPSGYQGAGKTRTPAATPAARMPRAATRPSSTARRSPPPPPPQARRNTRRF